MRRSTSRKRPHVEHIVDLSDLSFPVAAEIKELFNKKFTFQNPIVKPWCLSDIGEVQVGECCHFPRLQTLKKLLNDVKNQLSDKELAKWHEHTAFTNRAGKVIPHVRTTMNAELCTQAWCKFHEILCAFPLLPEEALENGELCSVHLCEAPGAFIASLNHYLKSHRIPCDWNWVANTLNPYHEGNGTGMMIMDDRLIAGTLPWWFFGPDDTGDIMDYKYLKGLIEFTHNMKEIHLVTADGSFDCQDNPGEQEVLVSPLQYCETITALMLLSPKGSFVLKMFTLFERSSVCLLYLLNCCFRQVHVFKPGTSKSGNSEVYVVCLDYLGKNVLGEHLEQLVQNFGPDVVQKAWLARATIPESFSEQLEKCCTFFHKCQTKTIQENLSLFGKMNKADDRQMETKRHYAAEFYLQKFQLCRVARDDWVVKRSQAGCSLSSRLSAHKRKKHSGSYNDRQRLAGLGWQERMRKSCLSPEVDQHCPQAHEADHALKGLEGDASYHSWYILKGRRLSRLASSPFCDVELLQNMVEAILQCRTVNREVVFHCNSCRLCTEDLVLGELAALVKEQKEELCVHDRRLVNCLVFGSPEAFSLLKQPSDFHLSHCEAVPPPPNQCTVLHDGEVTYQQWLLDVVFHTLKNCRDGDALMLPILSSFTRFTAGLIFVLQHCFQALDFVCPTSSDALGTLALLLCAGFHHPSGEILAFLENLREQVCQLQESESEQVLQFVPMDLLLRGTLPEFLSALNTAIAKQRLHLLMMATI
ncbi:cap-specific mRNA (nucleoside-2'-O-)-methyltransferase 2 isoform X2 [Mustelus asterias]